MSIQQQRYCYYKCLQKQKGQHPDYQWCFNKRSRARWHSWCFFAWDLISSPACSRSSHVASWHFFFINFLTDSLLGFIRRLIVFKKLLGYYQGFIFFFFFSFFFLPCAFEHVTPIKHCEMLWGCWEKCSSHPPQAPAACSSKLIVTRGTQFWRGHQLQPSWQPLQLDLPCGIFPVGKRKKKKERSHKPGFFFL